MPFDGSGNYSPPSAPTFPAVSGQVISSTYYNAVITDIGTALQSCLTRDGQGKPSAHIDWNGKNLTNVLGFAATSNATIGGTLGVTGAATFTGAAAFADTVAITGALTVGGATVWNSSNDGSGSGLDADTVDGVQASAIAQLSAANNFSNNSNVFNTRVIVYAAAPGFQMYDAGISTVLGSMSHDSTNMTISNSVSGGSLNLASTGGGAVNVNGNTIWHTGNDGPGSGLDADTVDGVQESNLAKLDAGNTFSGANNFSSNSNVYNGRLIVCGATPKWSLFEATVTTEIGYLAHDGTALSLVNSVNNGNIALGTTGAGIATFNGNTIWHAGNDGPGSGLDADLLDGAQGALYLKGSRTSQLVTDGTAAPSGGSDGDIYFQYVA